ncbi:hypothetical protein BB560_001905 [Smittium megazygosporum]|nr:hypothetical protein BB560_001905 [Smittium megazygosporum]
MSDILQITKKQPNMIEPKSLKENHEPREPIPIVSESNVHWFYNESVVIQNILRDKNTSIEINGFGVVRFLDSPPRKHNIKTYRGYGIFGIIHLNSGCYIILITEREKVGYIRKHPIYKIAKTKVEKIGNSEFSSHTQRTQERAYLEHLKYCLNMKSYYFSYSYDLTSSLQRQSKIRFRYNSWEDANSDFFFNYYLFEPLLKNNDEFPKIKDFILPVINGYFRNKSVVINRTNVMVSLITRRSRNNQGADTDGNVANFAETEQVLEFSIYSPISNEKSQSDLNPTWVTLSLLQIRGSAPFKWAQVICGKYKPRLIVDSNGNNERFSKHLNNITKSYNEVLIINLVDKNKYEGPIGKEFQNLINMHGSEKIRYFHYDFHSEAKKSKHEKIDNPLDDLLEDTLPKFGCFRIESGNSPSLSLQTGIIRTNCVDCLDRTNVLQAKVAFIWIEKELKKHGIMFPLESINDFPNFYFILRNIWADNADYLSLAYSGTPALKTDITR